MHTPRQPGDHTRLVMGGRGFKSRSGQTFFQTFIQKKKKKEKEKIYIYIYIYIYINVDVESTLA